MPYLNFSKVDEDQVVTSKIVSFIVIRYSTKSTRHKGYSANEILIKKASEISSYPPCSLKSPNTAANLDWICYEWAHLGSMCASPIPIESSTLTCFVLVCSAVPICRSRWGRRLSCRLKVWSQNGQENLGKGSGFKGMPSATSLFAW